MSSKPICITNPNTIIAFSPYLYPQTEQILVGRRTSKVLRISINLSLSSLLNQRHTRICISGDRYEMERGANSREKVSLERIHKPALRHILKSDTSLRKDTSHDMDRELFST